MFQFAILPIILFLSTVPYLLNSSSTPQTDENNQSQSTISTTPTTSLDLIKPYNPSKGPVDARVTVVKFLDFECPGCKMAHPITNTISQKYDSRVRFVYKMFPLKNIHPNAESAARSALAANLQGKYFEYADELFASQLTTTTNFQEKIYTENDIQLLVAQKIGLNIEQWNKDRTSITIENQVETDFSDGVNAQIPDLLDQNNLSTIDSIPSYVFIKDGIIQYKTNGLSADEFSEKLDQLLES